MYGSGQDALYVSEYPDWMMPLAAAGRRVFPSEVATHIVKMACELPDEQSRSLSLWTCAELARSLRESEVVDRISPQSIQRILSSQKLKPWRVHHWLSSKVPRDEDFKNRVMDICELYTRAPESYERVLSLDEKTSLQPRTRSSVTLPPMPGPTPARLEHEYTRKGALNLFAAFDVRTGEVTGILKQRKRQVEFIELLEKIEDETSDEITVIHLICDNVSVHHGKLVQEWLETHSRFKMHFTPVHCSWMNQVEQWFSILQRKRLKAPNFQDLEDLSAKITAFIEEWNECAHPFNWNRKSFTKILAKVDAAIATA